MEIRRTLEGIKWGKERVMGDIILHIFQHIIKPVVCINKTTKHPKALKIKYNSMYIFEIHHSETFIFSNHFFDFDF